MKIKHVLFILALVGSVGWGPLTIFPASNNTTVGSNQWLNQEVKTIGAQASNLDEKVLKTSLTAYMKARKQGMDNKGMLTIIDYSKPSTERRLWVVDVNKQKVLFNTWVAHGKNSGDLNSTSFSNEMHSLKSSLGVFVTSETYSGKHGYSLRIQGLERGINDNALRRDVVFHGAAYASGSFAKERGRLGKSWGCMAVSEDTIRPLINTIKGNTVVVAYYPDRNWLNHSTYLA